MPSQTDLDQGGTARAWVKTYLGPSVGWVWAPAGNSLIITAAGTYTLDPSVSIVQVNVAGAVTIILWAASDPTNPAGSQPGLFVNNPVTIQDIGGNAAANNITIQPAGTETIMGLTQIKITVNYGAFTLLPNPLQHNWSNISP